PRPERHGLVEELLVPLAAVADPEQGPVDSRAPAPVPSARAPEFSPRISALVHEGLELRVRHRRGADAERLQRHRVGPFLVVEHEWLVAARAEHEGATGDTDVARLVRLVHWGMRPRGIEPGEP